MEPTVVRPGLSSWNTTFSMAARVKGMASGLGMHAPPVALTPATARGVAALRSIEKRRPSGLKRCAWWQGRLEESTTTQQARVAHLG